MYQGFILKDSRLHSALTFPTGAGLSPPHAMGRLRWVAGLVPPFVWQTKREEAATCQGGFLAWLVGTSNLSVQKEAPSWHGMAQRGFLQPHTELSRHSTE